MKIGMAQYQKAAKPKAKKKSSEKLGPKIQSKPQSVEDILREKLPVRRKKATPKFPMLPMFSLLIGVLLSFWVMLMPEELDEMLGKVEISFFGKAKAQTSKTAKTTNEKTDKEEKTAKQLEGQEVVAAQAATTWTAEELSSFAKLSARKKQMDLREEELNKLEEELQRQKLAIDNRIKELEKVRAKISGVLKERVELDEQKIEKLVQVYSNMKPANAAKIFANINEDLAVEVLGRMKKKNAADILNLIEPSKAQLLSEKYAGYKQK